MWITRSLIDDLRHTITRLTTEHALLAQQNKAQEVTLDWFRVRITQLEHERAVLLKTYMGVTVPEMSIEKEQPKSRIDAYHNVPHFEDVGDDAARKLGLDWDDEGRVVDSMAQVK